MRNSVQLPVCTPTFITYHTYAAAGIALSQNPTANAQLFNQCTNIGCTKRFLNGYSSPELYIPNAGYTCFSALDQFPVSLRFTYEHAHEIIQSMLRLNIYVYYNYADDYYLPEKSWYQIRHMIHDGTITGYNNADQTYTIVAFDRNWVFRAIQIPQKDFQIGLEAAYQEGKFGTLYGLRVRQKTVPLDQAMIRKGLEEYLSSDFIRYPMDQSEDALGIVVHDYIAFYLQKLSDGSIPYQKMDWRILRLLWEHKVCMMERIRALEKLYGIGMLYSKPYQAVVDELNRLRMLYAVYNRRKRNSIPELIAESLLEQKRKEQEILTKLILQMDYSAAGSER